MWDIPEFLTFTFIYGSCHLKLTVHLITQETLSLFSRTIHGVHMYFSNRKNDEPLWSLFELTKSFHKYFIIWFSQNATIPFYFSALKCNLNCLVDIFFSWQWKHYRSCYSILWPSLPQPTPDPLRDANGETEALRGDVVCPSSHS